MSILSVLNKGNNEVVEGYLKEIQTENIFLKSVIQRMDAQLNTVVQKLDDIVEHVTKTSVGVEEVKTVDYYGKKRVLLPQAIDDASKMNNSDIRKLIHRAAFSHKEGPRKGYAYIYNKLKEITGIDVYQIGQVPLTKKDGIEGWKKDPSYINAILLKGIQKEAAVICKEILYRK